MFNVSNVLFNVLYADDTCIYISGSDINARFDVLNIELASLLEWLNANRLTLNVDKTFYMLFHRKRIKIDNLKLTIGQGTLKQTSLCKYLVLIIDNKLNWAAHIAHVKSKISKCVGIVIKARSCLSRKCLLDLYHSFAYPYLIYCVEIWGHAGDRLLHTLFLVQKKIVRIITFSAFLAHTAPIFLNLRLLPLNKIVLHRSSVFMFKLINNMLPNAMNSLIVRNNDTHHHNNSAIQEAKDMLLSSISLPEFDKRKTRRKTRIAETNMQDIITIFYEMKPREMPVFVAKNVNNLPPLSMNNFDMAHIIEEMSNIKCKMSILQEAQEKSLAVHAALCNDVPERAHSDEAPPTSSDGAMPEVVQLVTLLNMEWTVTMKTW